MPEPQPSAQLKKQLLRDAVQDNLASRQGRPAVRRDANPKPAPAPRRRSWLLWLVPVLLLAAGLPILRSAATAGRGLPAAPAGEVGIVPAAAAAAAEPAAEPMFAEPRPIDPKVFPLAVQRVVIDPGHGGEDTGTVGSGLEEKDLTLDIALRLEQRLEQESFEVHLTRTDDRALSLRERAQMANQARADLFLSIHINWIAERRVRGVETYYLGATDDPELNALARLENRRSGYSLADMRKLLEGIYTHVRQDESRHLASTVQRSLFRSLLRQNPELEDRGVKTAPFVVLVATEMPAILAEVSCLSNDDEAELLSRPLYREHIAEALSRGVRRYADEVNQLEQKGS